jgi:hypothetical protein
MLEEASGLAWIAGFGLLGHLLRHLRGHLCGRRAPGVNAPVAASHDPQLHDAPGPGDHHEQHAKHRGEQQRDPERQVPVSAEEADVRTLAVLQDEDQQQQEHQGKEHGRDPYPADAAAFHDVLSGQFARRWARNRASIVLARCR